MGVGSTTGTVAASGTRSDAGARSGAGGGDATIGTGPPLGSMSDLEAETWSVLGAGVGSSGAGAVSSVGAGGTSVLGGGAGSRFGAGAAALVGPGVVRLLGRNAGAAVCASSGVAVATVAGGSAVAGVALLVASRTGGGSVARDANATPAGMAVIAKAKAHSSMRTAVTACAGRNLAGWERPCPSGLNSLEPHDPILPSASNCSEPPGRRDVPGSSQHPEASAGDCCFKNSLVFVSKSA
jgi:hypothetical protein